MKRYPCRGALAIFIYCILVLMLTAAVYLLVLVFRGEAILNNSRLGIFISVLISIGLIAAAAVHLVGMFRKTIAFSETSIMRAEGFPFSVMTTRCSAATEEKTVSVLLLNS